MKLYDFPKSSASFRVRIAANLKGLDIESSLVDFRRDEQRSDQYLSVARSGLVPALVDGELTLTQSLAICRYLDHIEPSPRLFPKDPKDEAIMLSMALTIACDIHPLNNLRVLKYLREQFGQSEEAVNAWYAHWITLGFEGLEELVQKHGSDTHCFGETVSFADICLVPQMFNARRFNVALDAFPRLVAIDRSLQQHSAYRDAAPQMS
ncbi:MAG: maleylacetoacetate isomerase [Pseudomonadota bacterium]